MTDLENPPAGSTVGVTAYRVFLIETVLAVNPSMPRWSGVNASAFTDAREPGPKVFFNTIGHNCDVTQVPSRITSRGPFPFHLWQRFGDQFAFTDADAALRCAARLREFARWRSAWEGREPWRLPEREERPLFRVVELNHASSTTVVEASPVDPVDLDPAEMVREAARGILTEEARREGAAR